MRLATLLQFPADRRRLAKAFLRDDTRHDVAELITLAPVLGEQNPKCVPDVVRYMRLLIPDPPPRRARDVAANHTPTAAERERFTRERRASAARMRAIGAWRTADWLDAHPYMPAVNS